MTNEIRLAFAHPSERSEASSAKALDRISLRDHVVEVEIGAFNADKSELAIETLTMAYSYFSKQ